MKKIGDNKGITVVEILVVLIIAVILIMVTYMVLGVGYKSYKNTSERIDVQSQFRLVMDILETEVGHARNVTLHYYSSTDEIPVPDPKFNFLYIKPVGDEMYSLCKKDSDGEHVYETPYPLKEFTLRFQMDPSVAEANILTVWLNATGAEEFRAGILTQNTNITSVTSTSGYNTVYYEEY